MPDGEATEAIPTVRRRKPRIAAEEARRRVLDAGVRHALEGGLTVGFRHLPLERYIEEAEVSRASAYRQWGSPGGRGAHEDFVADLVQTLFEHPRFANGFSPATTASLTQGLQDNMAMLETADGRRRLFRDLIRVAAEQNFRDLIASREWRSYEVLYVAAANAADAEASPEMRATARAVEQRFLSSMAGFFQSIVGMLRMRPREGSTFHTIALATHVTVSGIAHRIDVAPELAELYVDGPAIDGGTTRWHFAALVTMHAVDALVEAVPDAEAEGVEA